MSGQVFQVATKKARVLTSLTIFLIVAGFLAPQNADAKPPKAPPDPNVPECGSIEQLYQWATLDEEWQFGNLNHNNSTYIEGDSVPYYTHITDLTPGAKYFITIEWDTTKGGYHALDYLTTYDRSFTPVPDPCNEAGASVCGVAPDTYPIPADPNIAGDITQEAGDFTIWGGSVDSLSIYTLTGNFTGDSSTNIDLFFIPASTEVVIAWGGHIASSVDWGPGSSAGMISGSPYHMRLEAFEVLIVEDPEEWDTCNVGNRDRSLSAAAVIIPATLTIIKDTIPNFAQPFGFTLTYPDGLQQETFSLSDPPAEPVPQDQSFGGLIEFGTYSVTENVPSGWVLDSIVCTDGSSQTPPTAEVDIDEGDDITCTFFNLGAAPAYSINKTVTAVDASGDGVINAAGDVIDYQIVVTNDGNADLTGVSLSDPLLQGANGTLSGPVERPTASCRLERRGPTPAVTRFNSRTSTTTAEATATSITPRRCRATSFPTRVTARKCRSSAIPSTASTRRSPASTWLATAASITPTRSSITRSWLQTTAMRI
jgi:hypothetical protein